MGITTYTTRRDFPHAVREIEHCWIELADGCRLAARLWLPEGAAHAPVPAILEYLPYAKRHGTAPRDALNHPYFAGNGYACVRVDIRGTGESEGLFDDEYSERELAEGCEVIDWIARQPWCSGAVGMIGISWGGFNGLQIAAKRPPALKTIVTLCSTDDRYADDIHYRGGALLNENHAWSATMLGLNSRPPDPLLVGDSWRDQWLARLADMPLLATRWLQHPARDAYWRHGSVCENFADIEIPVLAVGGWNDAYSNAIPRLLAGLESPAMGLIGPWIHKYPNFAVPGPAVGFLQECLRWWDQWLKGEESGILDQPKLRAYLLDSALSEVDQPHRAGRWVVEPSWPSAQIGARLLRLGSSGLDETGDDSALMIRSAQTVGLAGGAYCAMWGGPDLPRDQREDDAGSLCLDSAPLAEPLEILGAAELVAEVSVDQPQANLIARLCDVAPDGRSVRVSYAVLNLCHRDGHAEPQPLQPGQRYRLRLQLDDIGWRFPAGHRLRLALSTSYWPIIWPSATTATITLHTAGSQLSLPERAPRTAPPIGFDPPECAPPINAETLRPVSYARHLERDLDSGVQLFSLTNDAGKTRNLDHGLIYASCARERYSIHPDDPLSARAEAEWVIEMARDDWSIRTECRSEQWADAEYFYLRAEVVAFEDGEECFRRSWDESVPRRCL